MFIPQMIEPKPLKQPLHACLPASEIIPEEDKLFLQAQGSFFDEGS
jgi:hypothetical protein